MKIAAIVLIGLLALPVSTNAKGAAVALWMEGSVAGVESDGQGIRLVLTGRFWLEQNRQGQRSVVEVDAERGMKVTLVQASPFFAMTADWRGGTIRESRGALLEILRVAARDGRIVRLELAEANVAFGSDAVVTVVKGGVVRATDHSLR